MNGEFLRMKRKEMGLTQEELAKKIGVAQNTLSSYELGDYEPSVPVLRRISAVLSVSLDELLKEGVKQ